VFSCARIQDSVTELSKQTNCDDDDDDEEEENSNDEE